MYCLVVTQASRCIVLYVQLNLLNGVCIFMCVVVKFCPLFFLIIFILINYFFQFIIIYYCTQRQREIKISTKTTV